MFCAALAQCHRLAVLKKKKKVGLMGSADWKMPKGMNWRGGLVLILCPKWQKRETEERRRVEKKREGEPER